jgi:hypothetical protein
MGFEHLLVFQAVLHQRHQGVAGPLLDVLAQALVQADDFLHQGGEEAPGQAALFGQQGFQLQAELIGLALLLLEFAQVAANLELRRIDAMQRVLQVVPLVDGGDHLVGHLGIVLQVVQVVFHRAEELQDGLVDAEGGPAAGEVPAHREQVRVEALGPGGDAQQLALTLEQTLVGLQAEQAPVVLAVVLLGLGGQLEQQLAVVLLMVAEQGMLLVDLLQAQVERVLAVLQQRQDLAHHATFDQALLLRDDTLAQQVLQVAHLAAREQRRVLAYLGQQRLFGR